MNIPIKTDRLTPPLGAGGLFFLLALVSGIINIYGILHFGLVVTNATGHFSNLILEPEHLKTTAINILAYTLGAFWGFTCFKLAETKGSKVFKFMPIVLNLVIFSLVAIPHTSYLIPHISYLFFAMSSHNAIGIHFSNGAIRPSQITGVIISFGEDLAKFFFGVQENKKTLINALTIKIINVLGFLAGGFLAFQYQQIEVLYLPVLFYFLLLFSFSIVNRQSNQS